MQHAAKAHAVLPFLPPTDNSGVFRDIKAIGSRRVLEEGPNYKKVEVEQVRAGFTGAV